MALYKGNEILRTVPVTQDVGSRLTSNGTTAASGGYKYFWNYPGSTLSGVATPDNSQWRYRSIYTHGYLAGGYKGSNPWRAVNKMWYPTETTLYVGEQLHAVASYTKGVWSDYHAYIVAHGNTGTYAEASTMIASYSLFNGAMRMRSGDGFSSSGITYGYVGNDPKNEGLSYGTAGYGSHVGGLAMDTSRSDNSGANDIKGQSGWITGGGSSNTNRLHFASETMYSGWDSGLSGQGDANSGEFRGWFSHTSTYKYVTWSNSTWSSGWDQAGATPWSRGDYQCKNMSSKYGHHYIGTGSNVTIGKSRFSDSNGSILANFNKVRSYGEDNCAMGQDNGYVLGHYDGQQNNHTIRQSYSSDTEVTLGATAQPKGHYGQSSGACSTGAATVCAAQPTGL